MAPSRKFYKVVYILYSVLAIFYLTKANPPKYYLTQEAASGDWGVREECVGWVRCEGGGVKI
jgi:hypothetical protein